MNQIGYPKSNRHQVLSGLNDVNIDDAVINSLTGLAVLSFNPITKVWEASQLNKDSELYQGQIDCSGTPNYPASQKDWWYRVSVAGKIGGTSGLIVEVGDMIFCTTANAGGTEASVGTYFSISNKNITSATLAVLRAGTSTTDFVSPKVLSDNGFVFSAVTPLTISGGTTNQATFTTADTQDGLYIYSPGFGLQSGKGIVFSGLKATAISLEGGNTTGIDISAAITGSAIKIAGTAGVGIYINKTANTAGTLKVHCHLLAAAGADAPNHYANEFKGEFLAIAAGTTCDGIASHFHSSASGATILRSVLGVAYLDSGITMTGTDATANGWINGGMFVADISGTIAGTTVVAGLYAGIGSCQTGTLTACSNMASLFVTSNRLSTVSSGTTSLILVTNPAGTDKKAVNYGIRMESVSLIETGINVSGSGYTIGVSVSGTSTTAISVTGTATTAIGILTGTFGTGLSIAGTLTTGVTVGACTTAYNLTGNATDGFKITSGTVTNGVNLAGTLSVGVLIGGTLTTGVSIGACSTGITFTGQLATTGINFAASTVVTASLMNYTGISGKVSGYLFNGSMSTSILTDTFIADDFSVSCAHDGAAADTLCMIRRTWTGSLPQTSANANLVLSDLSYTTGAIGSGAGQGGNLIGQAITIAGTSNGAAVNVYGLRIDTQSHTRTSAANVYGAYVITAASATDVIYASNGSIYADICTSGQVGLNIGGTITTGINISACATGVKVSGILTTVSSRAISATVTVNNANFTDGYGTLESELTLTGITAGNTAATSSWVNLITGQHNPGGFICAQTNGIYEESACTVTGANLIFGMRMQALVADVDANLYPFSCVSAVNPIQAIFRVGAASSDMGEITDAATDTGKVVPLYKTDGGVVGYIKIYAHS